MENDPDRGSIGNLMVFLKCEVLINVLKFFLQMFSGQFEHLALWTLSCYVNLP